MNIEEFSAVVEQARKELTGLWQAHTNFLNEITAFFTKISEAQTYWLDAQDNQQKLQKFSGFTQTLVNVFEPDQPDSFKSLTAPYSDSPLTRNVFKELFLAALSFDVTAAQAFKAGYKGSMACQGCPIKTVV